MEPVTAREEDEQALVHPLDAERDSRLPPGAPWHQARIARIPVPGESLEDRIIRQRRWILSLLDKTSGLQTTTLFLAWFLIQPSTTIMWNGEIPSHSMYGQEGHGSGQIHEFNT
eukprot:3926588-Amphidinium_carterae.1